MCDPATLTTLAISAATTAGSSLLQNKAANERSQAQLTAQRNFQQDLDNQRNAAAAEFQKNLGAVTAPQIQGSAQQAAQERQQIAAPSYEQRTLLPGQADTSNAVRTAIVQDQNREIEANKGRAKSQALLEAFGDAELKRDIALRQNANRIGMYGTFAGGGLDNLQADLNAAQFAGGKYDNAAGVVQGLGTIGSLAAPKLFAPNANVEAIDWTKNYLDTIPQGPRKPGKITGAHYLID